MKTLLWLDDLRNPFLDKEGKVPKGKFTIHWMLNYEEFVEYINKFGLPDVISFDHDLADEHYTPEEYWGDYKRSKAYQDEVGKNYVEKTGKDCANWLVDYCIDNNLDLPEYYSHSANPVGRDNILGLLDQFKKFENKPKNKAKELYDKFLPIVRKSNLYETYHNKAKECANIVCIECIKEHSHESENKNPNAQDRWLDFWQEVQREISLL